MELKLTSNLVYFKIFVCWHGVREIRARATISISSFNFCDTCSDGAALRNAKKKKNHNNTQASLKNGKLEVAGHNETDSELKLEIYIFSLFW